MPTRLRCSLFALAALALATPARAQTAAPDSPPAPRATADEAPAAAPAAAPGTASESGKMIESSPVPKTEKNPVDLLPPDVIYPPDVDVQPKPIVWRREWPRFSTADWIVTGAGGAIAIASAIIAPPPNRSYGPVLYDDAVRNTLRLRNPQARFSARDVSDVLLSLEATWPFFVDAVITTWWFRGSPDAAAQMALVNGQALAIVTAIQGATNTMVGRQRPYGSICGGPEQPEKTIECEGNVRNRSFFSGHAAFAFMSAGLICVHHVKHGMLRGGGDTIACAVAYGGAAATALLRVAADVHFATDITVGTVVGTAVGLAVPLFHYRTVNVANEVRQGEVRKKDGVDVSVIPFGAGLGLGGTF